MLCLCQLWHAPNILNDKSLSLFSEDRLVSPPVLVQGLTNLSTHKSHLRQHHQIQIHQDPIDQCPYPSSPQPFQWASAPSAPLTPIPEVPFTLKAFLSARDVLRLSLSSGSSTPASPGTVDAFSSSDAPDAVSALCGYAGIDHFVIES